MKNNSGYFPLFLISAASLLFSEEIKLNIAVNELQAKGVEQSTAGIVSDRIRAELINTGIFRVMERAEMKTILDEQGFQRSDLCDQSCVVEMGQILGVDRMVAGAVGKMENLYTISLRMINVATGEILYTVSEDCDCEIKTFIGTSLSAIANKLAKGAGEEAAEISMRGKTGDLYVSTSIAGAAIEIDGKAIPGITPITLKGFAAGKHRIVARKENSFGSASIILVPNDLLRTEIPLTIGKGSLKLFTEPTEAFIELDGQGTTVAKTPLKLDDIQAGEHAYRITKEGFLDKNGVLSITTDETNNLTITLTPASVITVEPEPADAVILVNGRSEGKGALRDFNVPAGIVAVQVENPGYDVWTDTLNLKQGEHKRILPKLVYKFGKLQVQSSPPGARLFLNDKEAGITPLANNKILPGNYMLMLLLTNYAPIKENITVLKNCSLEKSFTLLFSQAYLDSMSIQKKYQNRKSRIIRSIVFGALSAGGAVGGIFFNTETDNAFTKYNAYKGTSQNIHDANWEEVRKNRIYRNSAYSLSGACLIAATISIFF